MRELVISIIMNQMSNGLMEMPQWEIDTTNFGKVSKVMEEMDYKDRISFFHKNSESIKRELSKLSDHTLLKCLDAQACEKYR